MIIYCYSARRDNLCKYNGNRKRCVMIMIYYDEITLLRKMRKVGRTLYK